MGSEIFIVRDENKHRNTILFNNLMINTCVHPAFSPLQSLIFSGILLFTVCNQRLDRKPLIFFMPIRKDLDRKPQKCYRRQHVLFRKPHGMIPAFHCSIIPIAERSGAKFCHALFALFPRCKQHLTSVLFHILPCSIPLRL